MPSKRPHQHPTKPWAARIKVDYQSYFLGYYATREEAIEVENKARLEMTGNEFPNYGGHLREAFT